MVFIFCTIFHGPKSTHKILEICRVPFEIWTCMYKCHLSQTSTLAEIKQLDYSNLFILVNSSYLVCVLIGSGRHLPADVDHDQPDRLLWSSAGWLQSQTYHMLTVSTACIRPAKLGRVKTSRFTRTTKMRHPSTYDDAKCATRAAVTNIHVYQYYVRK